MNILNKSAVLTATILGTNVLLFKQLIMIAGIRAKFQTLCLSVSCLGFVCASLTETNLTHMTCPAAQVGKSIHISCTASIQASKISIIRETTELVSCNASVCNVSLSGYRGDVTRNRTHQRVALVIEKVNLTDEGVLTCVVVRNEGLNHIERSQFCLFYVFVPPEPPYCNHASNSTQVDMTCTTDKVYPKAHCNWTVTSLSGDTPKVKFKTSSNVTGSLFTTTCRASFPRNNQTDYKVKVSMFAATLEGRDVSNGLAVATFDFDVASSSVESWSPKKTVVLVFFLMISGIIAVLLVYIFCFKRRRWHAKNDSGMYNDASIKLWMDQATSIPPEPQRNTIKEIVRRPKKDLPKAKVSFNIHKVSNEEESEPYAKVIKNRTSNNRMEDTQDSIYNNEMENTSDLIYNNEMLNLETSSTESTPCTDQRTNEKAWDTAMEPDEISAQTNESEELVSRQSVCGRTRKCVKRTTKKVHVKQMGGTRTGPLSSGNQQGIKTCHD